jgi:ABC-type sugar transport system substrate-binding protein
LGLFEEVALYGALIHVVTEDPDAHRPLIEQALRDKGVDVIAIDRIAPSLEDVFIASARRQEKHLQVP